MKECEIQLNEKLWFSKHKGHRVKDIIDNDIKEFEKILNDYNHTSFSDEVIKYYRSLRRRKSFDFSFLNIDDNDNDV